MFYISYMPSLDTHQDLKNCIFEPPDDLSNLQIKFKDYQFYMQHSNLGRQTAFGLL